MRLRKPKIFFKAFENDLSCRKQKFRLGKTYSVKGEIQTCVNGFHACERLHDTLKFYRVMNGDKLPNKFGIVKLSGDYDDDGEKICARNIEIVRVFNSTEIVNQMIKSNAVPKSRGAITIDENVGINEVGATIEIVRGSTFEKGCGNYIIAQDANLYSIGFDNTVNIRGNVDLVALGSRTKVNVFGHDNNIFIGAKDCLINIHRETVMGIRCGNHSARINYGSVTHVLEKNRSYHVWGNGDLEEE